ncbi:acyl carrier protein [Paenibacillus assamensis]|uniref:acyl carrier protein n=1 Tax=Paenibacillus assamensis TaxID=311244 RepID=UPI0004296895|nr:acyl carrier protein [Paenibacillus assamensis]
MQKQEIVQFLMERVKAMSTKPQAVETMTEATEISALGIDSVTLINLVVEIEQKFDIFLEDDEMTVERFNSVQDIAALISGKISVSN